jgi:hypothetical protein
MKIQQFFAGVPNLAAATNPATTTACHAEGKLRRFVDLHRYAERNN